MPRRKHYTIDVAISYASEDNIAAEAIYAALKQRNLEVFKDTYERADLWGKDLPTHLTEIYQNKAHFCIVFCSQHYAEKVWTRLELRAAMARALREDDVYILPVRIDDTEIPGLLSTTAAYYWPRDDAEIIADAVLKKLGREPYMPPPPPPAHPVPSLSVLGKHGIAEANREDTLLDTYLDKLEKTHKAGKATELSYRLALQELLRQLVPSIAVTHEPKREAYGSPDFMISRNTGREMFKVGYVETKDVDVSLDEIERDAARAEPKTHDGQQFKRYIGALDNFILTNYLEFRWYVHGERRMTERLVSPEIDKILAAGKKKGTKKIHEAPAAALLPGVHAQSTAQVARLLKSFLEYSTEPISSPKELALRMARIAHIIRDMTIVAFQKGEATRTLLNLYEAFKKTLLPDLDIATFADMFAQTLAYGLFAARYNHTKSEPFRRQDAAREIPNTNPFLADLFEKITGRELDNAPFIGFVDDLAQLLAQTDMNAVLADFGKRTRQQDPLIHFYETFLAHYDPKLRELRGVYYTPEPVVSYIVRSVDQLLRTHFNCPTGLADTSMTTFSYRDEQGNERKQEVPHVMLLDPSCGTGTFLYAVIDHIRASYRASNNAGMWSSYVSKYVLPRLFGFELLMAPYAMAHLKLAMQLAALDLPEEERQDWAYDFQSQERLGLYLTNTLEEAIQRAEILFGPAISDEANAAARVKQDYPVMVISGNPPYSGHSANRSWTTEKDAKTGKDKPVLTFIGRLLQDYYKVDGQPLGERNSKWLQDDYVKFIRFAQWRIERTGYGILAFITNHAYLNNPTFRGMRQSLMQSFDEIYVLNLHGNINQKERAPDGSKDENVFDIQQGVAISIFVRYRERNNTAPNGTVYYADLWGPREIYQQGESVAGKYHWLAEHDVKTTEWTKLTPQKPFYLFTPQDLSLQTEHEQSWKVIDMLPVNTVGVVTGQDPKTIALTFPETEKLAALQSITTDAIKPILYRPFDTQYIIYSKRLVTRPRMEVMHHMLDGQNIGLIFMRQVALQENYNHFGVTRNLVDNRAFLSNKGIMSLSPLYLYPDPNKKALFDTNEPSDAPGGRRPNLAPAFIAALTERLGLQFIPDGKGNLQQNFGPEDVFNYMYAVFHAPTYRERYAEFLKIDFPRLPLTSNADLFRALCNLGEQLVALHLMEASGSSLPSYPKKGEKGRENLVENVVYAGPNSEHEQGRVYINKLQYFEGVAPDVWEFHVGGYQVCQKWLKDRKGRTLSHEDIQHYQRIVAALGETITLMERIDEVIDEHGGWPIV